MISDITSKGVDEPYRMFTSRAEFRLSVRDNNTAERLLEKSFAAGLIDEKIYEIEKAKCERVQALVEEINSIPIYPTAEINSRLEEAGEAPLSKAGNLSTLLRRPLVSRQQIEAVTGFVSRETSEIWDRAEVVIKYSSFIEREKEEIQKFEGLASIAIPKNFDFSNLRGLTNEVKQKLTKQKPVNLAEASSIPGIPPAAISILIMHLKKSHE